MATDATIRGAVALFTLLVQRLVLPDFRFPKGEAARRTVGLCLQELRRAGALSGERLADFCICSACALSSFGEEYLRRRWRVSHSFGPRARERFEGSTPARRYREDRSLHEAGLVREALPALLRGRREHPLQPYVDPTYEEPTKRRALGTEAGYYICGVSTLLWNPRSAACTDCPYIAACRRRTQARYGELYRLRCEAAERRGRR